jgi:uncharacterized protein
MEILLALLAGITIGLVLGFVGAGGAMLAVPIMIYIFSFSPIQATTAALAVVGLAALSGSLEKFKKGEILVKEALTISTLGLATNIYFALLAKDLDESVITTGLALVLIIAGASMLIKPIKAGSERRIPLIALIALSLTIGVITGLFGIGGGFIAIPILVLFYNTPMVKAAGTSLFIIFLNSTVAFFFRIESWPEVNWSLPLIMATSAILISRIAARNGSKTSPQLLKRAFAMLLFAIALFTLLRTWVF